MSDNLYSAPSSELNEESAIAPVELPHEFFKGLSISRPWTLFLGVLMMFFSALSMFGTISAVITMSGNDAFAQSGIGVNSFAYMGGWMLGSMIITLLMFYIGFLLVRYSNHAARAVTERSLPIVTSALNYQGRIWRTIGICALLSLIFFLAVMGVGILSMLQVS